MNYASFFICVGAWELDFKGSWAKHLMVLVATALWIIVLRGNMKKQNQAKEVHALSYGILLGLNM